MGVGIFSKSGGAAALFYDGSRRIATVDERGRDDWSAYALSSHAEVDERGTGVRGNPAEPRGVAVGARNGDMGIGVPVWRFGLGGPSRVIAGQESGIQMRFFEYGSSGSG